MVTSRSVPDTGHRPVRQPWLIQLCVGLGVLVTTFDTGGINVSLFTISRHFGVDSATIAWLSLIAFLTITGSLLLFGRLSDMLGSKVIFVGGFVVYALGSALGGFAPSFPLLLAARGIQAVGISMLSANSVAILTESFPPHQRGMVLGINNTLAGLGFFVGPITGGLIIANFGWNYVFFGMVPLCIIGFLVGMVFLPSSIPQGGRSFDFTGAFLFALGTICLLLALNMARDSSANPGYILILALAAGLAFIFFIFVERSVDQPMLQLGLFRNRLFSISILSAFALFLGYAGQDFFIPMFSQQILRLDPATAGLVASTVPFARMLAAAPGGFISDRFGSRWPTVFGSAMAGIGLLGLCRVDASTSIVWIAGCLAVIGLGAGLYFPPNLHATMAGVPGNRLGMAAGAIALRRNFGQSISVALAAYLLQSGGGIEATVPGFQLGFSVQTAFIALSAVAAFMAGSTHRTPRPIVAENKSA